MYKKLMILPLLFLVLTLSAFTNVSDNETYDFDYREFEEYHTGDFDGEIVLERSYLHDDGTNIKQIITKTENNKYNIYIAGDVVNGIRVFYSTRLYEDSWSIPPFDTEKDFAGDLDTYVKLEIIMNEGTQDLVFLSAPTGSSPNMGSPNYPPSHLFNEYSLSYVNPTLIIDQIMLWFSAIVSGFIGLFAFLFASDGVLRIIYTTTDGLTIFGGVLLIPIGYFLVKWAFNWIRGLLQLKG